MFHPREPLVIFDYYHDPFSGKKHLLEEKSFSWEQSWLITKQINLIVMFLSQGRKSTGHIMSLCQSVWSCDTADLGGLEQN